MPNFKGFLVLFLSGVGMAFQLPSADGAKLGVGWFVILVGSILGTTWLILSKLSNRNKPAKKKRTKKRR
jgi:hypothetical protein